MVETSPETESEDASEDPRGAFLDALSVRRNGVLGTVCGLVVGLAVYARFVVWPASTTFPPALYLPLVLVVAFGVAVLVATVLTVGSAWRQLRTGREP